MSSKRAVGEPGRRDAVKASEGFTEQKALAVHRAPIWRDPGSGEDSGHYGRGVPGRRD